MPVKPMLMRVFCLAKVITAHGFTGHPLAAILRPTVLNRKFVYLQTQKFK